MDVIPRYHSKTLKQILFFYSTLHLFPCFPAVFHFTLSVSYPTRSSSPLFLVCVHSLLTSSSQESHLLLHLIPLSISPPPHLLSHLLPSPPRRREEMGRASFSIFSSSLHSLQLLTARQFFSDKAMVKLHWS